MKKHSVYGERRAQDRWLVVGMIAALASACGEPEEAGQPDRDSGVEADAEVPLDGEAPKPDGKPPEEAGPEAETPQSKAPTKLDILFVIDKSGSMLEEQEALLAQIPRLVDVLASGDLEDGAPDANGKVGVADFAPLEDIHLGVATSDLGNAGGDPNGTLGCAGIGDDGLLFFPAGCDGTDEPYLSYTAGDDLEALADNLECVVGNVGLRGCGFEQQLDAMLKALVSEDETTFFDDTLGHGAGANQGFLREDALLAVVMLTDEDDCSVSQANAELISSPTSGVIELTDSSTGQPIAFDRATPYNMRCGTFANALQPLKRYVQGLLGLKPSHPERVIFAAIAGLPPELQDEVDAMDSLSSAERASAWDGLLADPRLQFRSTSPTDPFDVQARPVPSCSRDHDNDPSTYPQEASPPLRLLRLVEAFGHNGTMQSICTDDFTPALDAILKKIVRQL